MEATDRFFFFGVMGIMVLILVGIVLALVL